MQTPSPPPETSTFSLWKGCFQPLPARFNKPEGCSKVFSSSTLQSKEGFSGSVVPKHHLFARSQFSKETPRPYPFPSLNAPCIKTPTPPFGAVLPPARDESVHSGALKVHRLVQHHIPGTQTREQGPTLPAAPSRKRSHGLSIKIQGGELTLFFRNSFWQLITSVSKKKKYLLACLSSSSSAPRPGGAFVC